MSDLVAIVPYRADAQGYRRRNASVILHWLSEAGIPVVVAEHSDEPDLALELPLLTARVHIAAEGRLFNKAMACNAAYLHTGAAIIALVDADTLMPLTPFLECVQAVRDGLDAVRPYGRLTDLDESSTAAVVAGGALPEAPPDGRDDAREGEFIPLCGGIVIVRSAAYASVGGMDESFQGWGGEDDALSMALIRSGRQCGINEPATAFHLYHPRTIESRYGHEHYASNRMRAQWWHESTDDEFALEVRESAARLRIRQG